MRPDPKPLRPWRLVRALALYCCARALGYKRVTVVRRRRRR